ncbi:hypothetical protein JW905_19070 [bacterium]|nr:hypothetical protein [candidate division CSSED10-310 bacterium]
MTNPSRLSNLETICLATGFFLLSILFTWPLSAALSHASLSAHPDLYGTVHYYWIMSHSLTNPIEALHSLTLFYPIGWEPLAYNSCYLDALVGGVLALLFGPLAALNIITILIPGLNAFVMMSVLMKNGFDSAVSLPAAIVFGFNPYVAMELVRGRPSQALLCLLPLGFHAMQRYLRAPAVKTAATTAAVFVLSIAAYYYYGLLLGLCLLAWLVLDLRSLARRIGFYELVRQLSFAALIPCIAAPLLLMPHLFSDTMSWRSLAHPPGQSHTITLRMVNSLSLNDFCHAGTSTSNGAPPLILLVIVTTGMFLPAMPHKKRWLLLTLFFLLAACGPEFYLNDRPAAPNPVFSFLGLLPLFDRFWWPYRLICFTWLGLSFLLTCELHSLLHIKPAAYRLFTLMLTSFTTILVLIAVLPDRGTFLHRGWHAPEAYAWLARQPAGAVVELPLRLPGVFRTLHLQTIHGKPLLFGSTAPPQLVPWRLADILQRNPFLASLESIVGEPSPTIHDGMTQGLTRLGFAYLVLNPLHCLDRNLSSPDMKLYFKYMDWLERCVGTGLAFDDGTVVYELR